MPQISYDKVTSRSVRTEKIHYGILDGNEKIVFIKVGADGSIRGYRDKYLKMAHRVHDRLGATVICASNPCDVEYEDQLVADQAMISKVAADCGFSACEVYFAGASDGGYHNLLLAQRVPQTVKLLGINASQVNEDDFLEKLQAIPHITKCLVYGTKDDAKQFVPVLQTLESENLEILTVEGADHEFTGMVDEFVALIDLI
ncbi:MAG: hypothetical protein IKV27_01550 [Lachnospiraceae bacterium]|nr:hypothetical protein [Lachnospiraceae bacterium]